ncbi:metallo-beta-lactamase domain-containing protein 1-like protein [Dinothrombium tinctorium]|uniref:Metallo-beta-lactamase domain-containing protein 1 n=1 Tax=Dinothrombium tinctorium TaxID=1965070 RepID=A0A443QN73_9ACAR|nr:metallo-beta-lactamase domain-containing protein 1-like protein [Dinothrombium tinctorium]
MSSFVKVIREGYSRCIDGSKLAACGSCTLIKSDGLIILVDTLGAWECELLKSKLRENAIHASDLDLVICTHGHPDHVGNLNLFLDSQHIVGRSIYRNDVYSVYDFEKPYVVSRNVKVVHTPGHTLDDVCVIVENVDRLGTVTVAGDLFENEADIEDESIWRNAGSEAPEKQVENRKLIMQMSEFIVPGHGPMFKRKK